jgi:pilus assembly protein Flp/PilA
MSFIKDENGQGLLEYILIVALVAVIAIGALIIVNGVLKRKKTDISSQMNEVDNL